MDLKLNTMVCRGPSDAGQIPMVPFEQGNESWILMKREELLFCFSGRACLHGVKLKYLTISLRFFVSGAKCTISSVAKYADWIAINGGHV